MTKGKITGFRPEHHQKEAAAISALEDYIDDAFVNAVQTDRALQRAGWSSAVSGRAPSSRKKSSPP